MTEKAARNLRPKAPKREVTEQDDQQVSKYQSFVVQRVCRKDIHGAEYNPRVIDPDARAKLMVSLKKNGLVEPIIVNKRTMNIVGGHQRLAILDDLEDDNSYHIDVSMIDVSEAVEKQVNIALNADSMRGQYDTEKLMALLTEVQDIYATGMDPAELELMGVEASVIGDLFDLEKHSKEAQDAVKELEDIGKLKEARKKHISEEREEQNKENTLVLVFKNGAERARFNRRFGISDYGRYLEGKQVSDALGIRLDID